MTTLKIALCQINPLVGDIVGNSDKIIREAQCAAENGCNIAVFPELCLTGYPPEDLLLRPSIDLRVSQSLKKIVDVVMGIHVVVGYPKTVDGELLNMAGVIYQGEVICEYAKQCLPNYQVFDEKRYFSEGKKAGLFNVGEVKVGLSICEDIWDGSPISQSRDCGADLLLNLNASPYHTEKQKKREKLVATRAKEISAPIVYVNQVGGQDELVFDGGSMAMDADGEMIVRCQQFESDMAIVTYDSELKRLTAAADSVIHDHPQGLEGIYQALVLGVKDYVNKNNFKAVVLGLSGGIDSALTLAIAVDALGATRVKAVMMPFRYTSDMSKSDAKE